MQEQKFSNLRKKRFVPFLNWTTEETTILKKMTNQSHSNRNISASHYLWLAARKLKDGKEEEIRKMREITCFWRTLKLQKIENSEKKWKIVSHSDLFVEIKDKVERSWETKETWSDTGWHFSKYYDICQSKFCSEKSDCHQYFSRNLIVENLISQQCRSGSPFCRLIVKRFEQKNAKMNKTRNLKGTLLQST